MSLHCKLWHSASTICNVPELSRRAAGGQKVLTNGLFQQASSHSADVVTLDQLGHGGSALHLIPAEDCDDLQAQHVAP